MSEKFVAEEYEKIKQQLDAVTVALNKMTKIVEGWQLWFLSNESSLKTLEYLKKKNADEQYINEVLSEQNDERYQVYKDRNDMTDNQYYRLLSEINFRDAMTKLLEKNSYDEFLKVRIYMLATQEQKKGKEIMDILGISKPKYYSLVDDLLKEHGDDEELRKMLRERSVRSDKGRTKKKNEEELN